MPNLPKGVVVIGVLVLLGAAMLLTMFYTVEADEVAIVQRFGKREYMLGAVSKVRFEPARISGLPVAVNMVWLVTQTTVHAPKGGFLQQGSGQTGVKKPRV